MKKYLTEEERKEAQRERNKRNYQKNREKILERQTEYRRNNKERIDKYQAEYYQNNKEKVAKQHAEYYQANKEKIAEKRDGYFAEYYQANKEKLTEKKAEYHSTPKGRASKLLGAYNYSDKKQNRGECTLTSEWIAEHIFNQPCHYCGKTDWHELGCDRIDNALPHTPDNVVPCCCECNKKRGTTPYDEFMRLIKKVG